MITSAEHACGAVYVAFGEVYLLQALHSISTLQRHNPDLPVLVVHNVVGDVTLPAGIDATMCMLRRVEAVSSLNREYKSSFHRLSPFERTVFLDCDTEIKGSLSRGFEFLDFADIAIRPEPAPYAMSVTEMDPEEAGALAYHFGEFNTGVIFAKRSLAAMELLDTWNENVLKNNKRDQKHFVRSVSVRRETVIWPLSAAWNYMRYDVRTHARASLLRRDPYIWHYMDYSYSLAALVGVWEIARETDRLHLVKSWPYVKRHIVRPFMTRYAGMKVIDKIRAIPRKIFHGLRGRTAL